MILHQSYLSVNWQSPVNCSHALNRGLVAWWIVAPHWSGGTTLRDLFGRCHGTLTSMAPATDWKGPQGRRGGFGCLSFANLTDDYVTASKVGNWSGGDGTVMMWARKTAATAGSNDYLMWTHFTSATDRIFMEVETQSAGGGTDSPQISAAWAGFDTNRFVFSPVIMIGRWYHVAITWAVGVPMRMYVDGVLVSTSVNNFAAQTATATERIGNYASGSLSFGGDIDDVRRFERQLSAVEVSATYQESLAGHPGTLNRLPLPRYAPQGGGFIDNTNPILRHILACRQFDAP